MKNTPISIISKFFNLHGFSSTISLVLTCSYTLFSLVLSISFVSVLSGYRKNHIFLSNFKFRSKLNSVTRFEWFLRDLNHEFSVVGNTTKAITLLFTTTVDKNIMHAVRVCMYNIHCICSDSFIFWHSHYELTFYIFL